MTAGRPKRPALFCAPRPAEHWGGQRPASLAETGLDPWRAQILSRHQKKTFWGPHWTPEGQKDVAERIYGMLSANKVVLSKAGEGK
jgi:hypothetical protein